MTKQEYMKEYYKKNKEKMREQRKEWLKKNPDWKKNYYEKNKEKLKQQNKEWIQTHKEQFIKKCNESRRRRVDKLKEEGCTNSWAVVVKGATPKYKEEK